MDFLKSAEVLVPALSGIPVTVSDGTSESLKEFEARYCFYPDIQKWFTQEGMADFLEKSSPEFIYELTDALDVKVMLFKIEEHWVILGPFVNRTWNEREMRELLAGNGFSTAFMVPYKLYRCRIAVSFSSDVLRAATVIIENTVGNMPPKEIKEVFMKKEHYPLDGEAVLESLDIVNRRYYLENRFMDAIYEGRTKLAVELFRELNLLSVGLKYYSPDIRNGIAGAAIMRTLARKAAERAGLTPVVIDAVSQQYAQQIHLAVRTETIQRLLEKYISEVCVLVRKEQKREYSIYVKKAVQYIEVHLSESLTIKTLAESAGLTPAYLAKIFRKETGMTVSRYVARTRCFKAAELLAESDLSVQEISAFVGYLDNNYFAKIFKKHMGAAPLDYRKQHIV